MFASAEVEKIATALAYDRQLTDQQIQNAIAYADDRLRRFGGNPVHLETYRLRRILSLAMKIRLAGAACR